MGGEARPGMIVIDEGVLVGKVHRADSGRLQWCKPHTA